MNEQDNYGANDNPVFYVESLQDKIQELEEKLAEAQKSLVDYETDWRKMRKYYDGAMEKMAIAIEALEKADKTLSLTYYSFQKVRQDINEALEKIKR